MGQYRQWLHLREVDQKLHTQLAILEQDLAQLQEQAHLLLADDYATDNIIIQALARQLTPPATRQTAEKQYLSAPAPTLARNGAVGSSPSWESAAHPVGSPPLRGPQVIPVGRATTPGPASPQEEHPSETISPALFGWSQLPNFDSRPRVGGSLVDLNGTPSDPYPPHPVPPTPRMEDLLPEDITAFVDEHSHTIPSQIKLPRWFNNTLPAAKGPIDQQSVRTNRLVQRWLERWRKPDQEQQNTQKDQVR
ncbi:MAG TPA: hypothetical protein VKR06_23595 [Ktedonosporobacter sp.]|nr:hypothetical protein [Ktedonosporobacter sp.]